MNGCAVSILYFFVILPGTMVADVFLGGNGIFSVLGIVVAFVLYATRTPSPESPPAPPASDDLTSLRQLVFDLQQQVQALRGELRQLQAKVANQPRIPITLPLRLEETPQAVSTEMPKHFPPPASAAAQAAAPSDDWQLPDLDDLITTPTKAAASAAPPKPVRPPKPHPIPTPADDNTFVAGRQPPPRPRPAPPPPATADDADDRAPSPLAAFFSENLLLKAGIAILFLGLAFLLRYASTRVHISIPLRYCAVAATAAVLAAAGWHLRTKRRDYALAIQGAALAILYLTALAALKLHALLDPPVAFALMTATTALLVALAVVQNARVLAQIALVGGLAAPVLTASGSNNYLALFTYLALLNSGVALIARYKAWRSLNLIGFSGTLAIAGSWGSAAYDPAQFLRVEPFLIYHLALYTAIVWRYCRQRAAANDPPTLANNASLTDLLDYCLRGFQRIGNLDSTLLCATALGCYGLQYSLAAHLPYGAAWSALAFALWYGGVALLARQDGELRPLAEASLILAALFAILAIPLALDGRWTASSWSLQAALVYYLATRHANPISRLGALTLQLAAAVALLSHYRLTPDAPSVLQGSLSATLLTAASGSAILLTAAHGDRADRADWERNLLAATFLATILITLALPLLFLPFAWAAAIWLIEASAVYHLGLRLAHPTARQAGLALAALALLTLITTYRLTPYGETLLQGSLGITLIIAACGSANILGWWQNAREPVPPWETIGQRGSAIAAYSAAVALPLLALPPEWAAPLVAVTAFLLALIQYAYCTGEHDEPHPATRVFAVPVIYMTLAASFLATLLADHHPASLAAVALAMLATAWLHDRQRRYEPQHYLAATPLLLFGSVKLVYALEPWLAVLFPASSSVWALLITAALLHGLSRFDWRDAGRLALAWLPLYPLILYLSGYYGHADAAPGEWLLVNLAAIALHALTLTRCEGDPHPSVARIRPWLHGLGYNLHTLNLMRLASAAAIAAFGIGSLWLLPALLAAPLLALTLPTLPALQPWTNRYRDTYHGSAALPLVAAVLLTLAYYNLHHSGSSPPLPYLPFANPLEIMSLAALWLLWRWWQQSDLTAWTATLPRALPLAVLAWIIVSLDILRIWHHYLGVPWRAHDLLASFGVQASLSLTWALGAITLMASGHKRQQRRLWTAGAALMGVVIVKLFVVELGDSNGIARIVSFIGVGVLLLLVSYYAPAPKKDAEE
ncbi:DUF2339 domain-containing protein [Cardiobacterium hominis]|uniref:DUF2339 domain-containing protein n=1 Tax=Cardiobacterium hominis TaxID=2718 RepID=UPI0028D839A9|nr:DUF2339 domain-containing protein [Cardiobacterium hominis]